MLAWRLSKYPDLSGRGGLIASGRWHTRPQQIIYAAEDAHTAYLEVLRHVNGQAVVLPDGYRLIKMVIPDTLGRDEVFPADLDVCWSDQRSGPQICRPIGDRWLALHRNPLLRVPSAVRLGYFNILINPVCREIDEIRIVDVFSEPFPLYATDGESS